jgi:tRNA(Ile)-lysidine synthase TilS/MesJ
MDGLALVVLLQDKHTRPLVIGRVLFDHGALPGSFKDIRDKNTICRKLIIPVIRDE